MEIIDASISDFAMYKRVYLKHATYIDNVSKLGNDTDENILNAFCKKIQLGSPDADEVQATVNSIGGIAGLRNYQAYMNGSDSPVDIKELPMLISWIKSVQEIEFAEACITEVVTSTCEMMQETTGKLPIPDNSDYIQTLEAAKKEIENNTIIVQSALHVMKTKIGQLSVQITQFFALICVQKCIPDKAITPQTCLVFQTTYQTSTTKFWADCTVMESAQLMQYATTHSAIEIFSSLCMMEYNRIINMIAQIPVWTNGFIFDDIPATHSAPVQTLLPLSVFSDATDGKDAELAADAAHAADAANKALSDAAKKTLSDAATKAAADAANAANKAAADAADAAEKVLSDAANKAAADAADAEKKAADDATNAAVTKAAEDAALHALNESRSSITCIERCSITCIERVTTKRSRSARVENTN